MTHDELVERVARAIEAALNKRPFGLYDYSNYPDPNAAPPHVVRDETTGKALLRTEDRAEAQKEYERLSRNYIGSAALAAVYEAIKEPTPEMKAAHKWGSVFPGGMSGNVNAEVWSTMLAASPLNPEAKA